jgi:predicted choloylglycine hydrolase
MPELLPLLDELRAVAGADAEGTRFLTLYRPPPFAVGCSQAIWLRGQPTLVRNYDYHPRLFEGRLWHTRWLGTAVIGTGDCLWGLLDGMNEHGLAVALAYGGRHDLGDGFGVPLILRYLLQVCRDRDQAVAALERLPSHMAYNVSVVDRAGGSATVELIPDRPARVTSRAAATNHQQGFSATRHPLTMSSLAREQVLVHRLRALEETAASFAAAFLEPPLYRRLDADGYGTLYTASYRPRRGVVHYRWPGLSWRHSFDAFDEGRVTVQLARAASESGGAKRRPA